jgi:hypothetical protein
MPIVRLPPIHIGATSPVGWPVRFLPSAEVPDLTLVTSASLSCLKPGDSGEPAVEVVWPLTIKTRTALQVDAFYAFAAGDIDRTGYFYGVASVVLNTGETVRGSETGILPVNPKYDRA